MSICAVCRVSDGLVINIIVAEVTNISPYPECILVESPDTSGNNAEIGNYWDGTMFNKVN